MRSGTIFPLVSLRARMTFGFAVVFGLVISICCVGMLLWSRYEALRSAKERVKAAADLMATKWSATNPPPGLGTLFAEIQQDEELAHVSLLVDNGRELPTTVNNRPPIPWPYDPKQGWIIASAPLGGRTAVAGLYWHGIERELFPQTALVSGFGLGMSVLATFLMWVFIGRTLRPIGALSEQASLASNDALYVDLVAPSTDAEVRLLVSTLNGMLDRLRQDTRSKAQFYAAAAHELRTPLAVLSASIESMLVRRRSTQEYEETFSDLLQQTNRLIALTESLLLLNRLEMRTDAEAVEAVDLADVCERSLEMLRLRMQERGLTVALAFDTMPIFMAPPTQVQILVRNLMENAIRYSLPERVVSVTVGEKSGIAYFRVFNECLLPDNFDVERLFQPFYRAEQSRSAATGGNGLGLAICRALADARGWELSLQQEPRGMAAEVRFGNGVK